ncbi:MAG: threonine--tRNA ligase [Bacteroidia bacterium]
MIKITFPDGREQEYESGITGLQIAEKISRNLAKEVLGISVNGDIWDLTRPITQDAKIVLYTFEQEEGKKVMWHSSAHLLAEALEIIYPGVKFGIGPPVANGFYYDVDLGGKEISADDFSKIEKLMLELAQKKNPYIRKEVSKAKATEYFTKKGDEYKLELIQDLQDGQITFYEQGNFTDLCKGPHLPDTGYIKAVKLMNIAGAYWRGDEKNKQLTRIYGVTFPKQKLLEEYLVLLEEAKKRDHRKLGKELDLFTFSEKVGAGLVLWLPKGAAVRDRLEQFMRKAQVKAGYLPVVTPHIGSKELYVTSGHYAKYGADSFQPIRTPNVDEEYFLKPMNCPHHCEIYASRPRSYKDLPLRFAEFGTVYRYEQSGELHGLTRVRGFTQDDAHLFCRPEQVKDEFIKVIDLVLHTFKALGFNDYTAQISLRDPENKEKYIGSDENWEKSERAIIEAAAERGLKTVTELGEAAFYGPKLDFMVKDVLGRQWQLGTIQVDYNLPERFELEYIGADNQKHRPVMIHRAPFGSLERFMAILIEQCAGDFPLWLAPEQVVVIPVADKFLNYAQKVCNLLNNSEIRTSVDDRNEKIGKKIRDAEVQKTPYMIIVGEKEEADDTVSARRHKLGDIGTFTVEEFLNKLNEELTLD